MEAQTSRETLFQQLGSCLEYPTEGSSSIVDVLEQQVSSVSNMALYYFQEFAANINKMKLTEWQEYYVRTFDVTPQCGLYLSVYLFGEENYKRSELMTGLKAVYEKYECFKMTELPDHLAVVLKQNSLFSEEEWSELVSMCIIPGTGKIIELLEKHNNPYAFLLKAINELLVKMEKAYV